MAQTQRTDPFGSSTRSPLFVDWDLAAATAGTLGKSGPRVSLEEATDVVRDLKRLADQAIEHVEGFTGLTAAHTPAPVRVVDRKDWADTNIAGLRQVVAPLLARVAKGRQPGPFTDAVGSRVAGVQAGTVLAYLSGKVLGQYEVFSADPGQLLLVAPNIVEVERKLEAVPHDFRMWVCLHEVTHRTQFTAVPWLRAYFLGEVAAFVDAGGVEDEIVDRLRRAIGTVAEAVRDQESRVSLLDVVQTPAQRAVLERITALMTLLEGHAEFVMDGVGPEVVPSVATSGRGSTGAGSPATRWSGSSGACSASMPSSASTPRVGASCTRSSPGSAWPASTGSGSHR